MALRIEIDKHFVGDRWRLRIGDLTGSSESLNISEEDLIKEIKEEMKKLRNGENSV